MKLFKLFALSLVALPSVALGMTAFDLNTELYGKNYSKALAQVPQKDHQQALINYALSGHLKEADLEYILAPERAAKLVGFGLQFFKNGRRHVCAVFTQSSPSRFVFWDNGIPMPSTPSWYRRPTVWAAAAALGLSCYYRNSLWAGIKSLFSR